MKGVEGRKAGSYGRTGEEAGTGVGLLTGTGRGRRGAGVGVGRTGWAVGMHTGKGEAEA